MAKEQAYLPNGSAAEATFDRDEFANHPEYMMGTVYVWVWRRKDSGIEVLVQKRSMNKKVNPGMLSVSAAGHIDAGETQQEAAVREFGEELGLQINADDLLFIFAIRKTNTPNVITWTYLYEARDDFSPEFNDGEVDAVYWKTLDEFGEMTKNPRVHNFANHGAGYYTVLLERINML